MKVDFYRTRMKECFALIEKAQSRELSTYYYGKAVAYCDCFQLETCAAIEDIRYIESLLDQCFSKHMDNMEVLKF